MTQIKKIKGIVGRLPKYLSCPHCYRHHSIWECPAVGNKNAIIKLVLNTELPDPNECACVDVEEVVEFLANRVPFYADPDINEIRKIANAIATSNCVKWREGDSPKGEG